MKNVLILGAGGQIARHVINQLADKQTIKGEPAEFGKNRTLRFSGHP